MPVVAARREIRPKMRVERESERVVEPLPEQFRDTLQIQGIDTPLSLRFVTHSSSSRVLLKTPSSHPPNPYTGESRSLPQRLRRDGEVERLRESMSTPFLSSKVLTPELPLVVSPRPTDLKSRTTSKRKDSLLVKKRVQFHRMAVDFSNSHRIRLLRKERAGLKPLLM